MIIDRLIETCLRIALLLAALGSIVGIAQIALGLVFPASYYWWGIAALIGGCPAFASAAYLHAKIGGRPERPRDA